MRGQSILQKKCLLFLDAKFKKNMFDTFSSHMCVLIKPIVSFFSHFDLPHLSHIL